MLRLRCLLRKSPHPLKLHDSLITDLFKGIIPMNGNEMITELILMHKPYADMGNFILFETNKKGGKGTVETRGNWTVLRGSATDENATVVEIDAPEWCSIS
jgi:hypothetical protein